jgi:hypothetical protein
MIEKTSFDSHPYPAGTNRLNAQVGLLTHLICCAFPVFTSGKECNKHNSNDGVEIHSNRNCSGFAPDSLFTLRPAMWLLSSLCTAKVNDSFEIQKFISNIFFVKNLISLI